MSRHDPATPDFVRDEFPFYWVARVYGVYLAQMEQALKPIGLDLPTWRILFILAEHGHVTMSEITLHAIAKLSTIAKTVQRMKHDGLIETYTSPHDARVTVAMLTEAGRDAIERSRVAIQPIFARSYDGLTPTQIRRLNDSLQVILRNLSLLHSDAAAGRVVPHVTGERASDEDSD